MNINIQRNSVTNPKNLIIGVNTLIKLFHHPRKTISLTIQGKHLIFLLSRGLGGGGGKQVGEAVGQSGCLSRYH
jgi:hypothetical protein